MTRILMAEATDFRGPMQVGSHALARQFVAGGANAYRRLPGVRATPLTPVKTGGVEASRRNVQVKPVAGAGTAVANPSMPCNGDCNHRHA